MKKIFIVVLSLLLLTNNLLVGAYNEADLSETQKAFVEIGKQKEITDPEEIKKIATEGNLGNPDDIVKIVYCYFDEYNCEPASLGNHMVSPCYLGNDYYIVLIDDTKEEIGKLLRSSYFASPGGTMTVTESVSATVSLDVKVDYKIISASLGFDIESKFSVSETQKVKVPTGKTYNVKAYVNNLLYEFSIWENDLFEDDKVDDYAVVKKPIGVTFVIEK